MWPWFTCLLRKWHKCQMVSTSSGQKLGLRIEIFSIYNHIHATLKLRFEVQEYYFKIQIFWTSLDVKNILDSSIFPTSNLFFEDLKKKMVENFGDVEKKEKTSLEGTNNDKIYTNRICFMMMDFIISMQMRFNSKSEDTTIIV